MSKVRSVATSLAVLVLAVSFGATSNAFAQHSADDVVSSNASVTTNSSSSGDTTSSSTGSRSGSNRKNTEVGSARSGENETESSTTEAGDDSGHTELHNRGAELLKEMKAEHKSTKSADQLKKVCENHKGSVNGKANGLLVSSKRIQKNIDAVYTKAQAYQQKNNLQPAGYQDLIAAADLAKAKAGSSVAALEALKPTVTCDDPSTAASDLATFKAAAQQTRDDLKAYRDSVKDVLKALETAKSDNGSTN